jgi:serine/threonine-protein kinase
MHLATPPEPPRRHAPQLPAALETVILTLLSKDPRDRYPSARAAADALAAVRDAPRA